MSILVVDDNAGMRVALFEALKDHGLEVDIAEDGFEALDKIMTKPYDWVISDVRMPEMSGIDLVRKIKKLRPECKIVMISLYGPPQGMDEIGIAGFFKKPVDIQGLYNLINTG